MRSSLTFTLHASMGNLVVTGAAAVRRSRSKLSCWRACPPACAEQGAEANRRILEEYPFKDQ